mgnify:CR=1 FL=1
MLSVKELYISQTNALALIKAELLFDEAMIVFMIDISSNKTQFVKKTTTQESIECIYWLNKESFAMQNKDNNAVKIQNYDINNILIEEKKLITN